MGVRPGGYGGLFADFGCRGGAGDSASKRRWRGARTRAECPCHARRKKPPAKRVHKRRAGGFQMVKAQRVIGEQSERIGLLDSRSPIGTRRLGRGSAEDSELAHFASGPVECPELSGIACALCVRQPLSPGVRYGKWPVQGAPRTEPHVLMGLGWPVRVRSIRQSSCGMWQLSMPFFSRYRWWYSSAR